MTSSVSGNSKSVRRDNVDHQPATTESEARNQDRNLELC